MKKILFLATIILCMFVSINTVHAEDKLDCSILLKRGSKGAQVKQLQKELNEVQNCNLEVDGSFGLLTRSCVLKFQKANALKQDALVGPQTCQRLNEKYNNSEDFYYQTPEPTSGAITSTLSRGSKNNEVKTLQELLNQTTKCNLAIDGDFGYKTEWCLKKYQEANNLSSNGKTDYATRNSLNTYNKNNEVFVIIGTSTLNVRQSATTNSQQLSQVYISEVYKIYETRYDNYGYTWYKIEYQKGYYGYIRSDYTTKNFIKLDISEQNLKLYKDGKITLNVPVVTGNISKGHDTPLGVYSIGNKLSKDTMGGRIHLSKYNAYVDYWIPFIGGSYGFHDADWRTSYQLTHNTTYLTNGSHGCVNMITEDARALYNAAYKGLSVHIVN